MNDTIRVCLIGCGRAGMIHARSYMGGIKGAELAALCDPAEEGLKAASETTGVSKIYQNWQDVMKDPEIDAVIVVTPTQFHHDIVIASRKCRKTCLLRKTYGIR